MLLVFNFGTVFGKLETLKPPSHAIHSMCTCLAGILILEFSMAHQPGTAAPQTGIYWCSVCKTPAQFKAGENLPTCKNLCGRGKWEFVKEAEIAK
jgi:hypothetical protein